MDHRDFKAACSLVRKGQRQVHERVKLDGMELAVLHGADEGRLVQALQSNCELGSWPYCSTM